MNCMIRVSPDGKYDVVPARYISGFNAVTYPSIIDDVAVIGRPIQKNYNTPNYLATCLIHRTIIAVLDGYAYICKANSGLDFVKSFTKQEAESLIHKMIKEVGGIRRRDNDA